MHDVGCSILAKSFPISSLSSFRPLGGCHLVLLIKLHLFQQFDLNELGCCPLLDLISSACVFLGNPKSVWISLIPFQVNNSFFMAAIPFHYETATFASLPIITEGFRFSKEWPKRKKKNVKLYLCPFVISDSIKSSNWKISQKADSIYRLNFFFLLCDKTY